MTKRSRAAIDAVIKAYDVRGVVGDGIDEELMRDAGAAFGLLMRREGAEAITIGHDMRDSSPGLSRAFAEGAAAQGVDVVMLGLTSTDQLYFASGTLNCPGAMFTASWKSSRMLFFSSSSIAPACPRSRDPDLFRSPHSGMSLLIHAVRVATVLNCARIRNSVPRRPACWRSRRRARQTKGHLSTIEQEAGVPPRARPPAAAPSDRAESIVTDVVPFSELLRARTASRHGTSSGADSGICVRAFGSGLGQCPAG